MFHSTNTQTNLRHWRVLSKEWDHQVWSQSNFVWVTNRRLEDNRFRATKSGQISCFSLFFVSHVEVCVLHSIIFLIAAAAFPYLRMEARVFLTCFLGNNFRRWSRLCDQHAHNNQDLDSQVIIIMWRSILSWLTTCPIINCCVPFWSNSDDISCSLGDGRQCWDNQVESLVYHLL